jgi:general secretion pathway protein L
MKGHEQGICFLFLEHLDVDGCLSLRLDPRGEQDAALQKRTPDELIELQMGVKTIAVIPTAAASLHVFELPWLGERKAREAIPYALEERVAQPVTELHFAFDKAHYQNGQYLVVVIDKQRVMDWMGLLAELDIDYDQMTLDWFALAPGEMAVMETGVLVNHPDFKGALSPNLAKIYLNQTSDPTGLLFDDSHSGVHSPDFVSMEGSSRVFVAKRLAKMPFIQVCQGALRHDTHHETNVRWYALSLLFFVVWLCVMIGMNALMVHQLSKKITDLDQQIAVIYHDFFPNATTVISPKFRVEQALKTDATGHQGAFWYLLGQLVAAMQPSSQLTIQQLHFQNQTLTVGLMSDDFASLEAFENRLKKMNLQVTQTAAASQEKKVVATLELRG